MTKEISQLEGKVQALDTALSLLRIRVTELENLNKLAGYTGYSGVTPAYTDSFPDLSTAMLVSALVSDSSSSSSYDSSSSCGGE